LTKDEYKNLCQISPTSQNEHFCSLCAEKESYLKYTGLGRVLPLSNIHIADKQRQTRYSARWQSFKGYPAPFLDMA